MSETKVWRGDKHAVSWRVTSAGALVDLTGATVRLVAKPREVGGEPLDLECSVTDGVVTHQLDGSLPVARYDIVVEASRLGQVVTYPDAATGPEHLIVRADVG